MGYRHIQSHDLSIRESLEENSVVVKSEPLDLVEPQ